MSAFGAVTEEVGPADERDAGPGRREVLGIAAAMPEASSVSTAWAARTMQRFVQPVTVRYAANGAKSGETIRGKRYGLASPSPRDPERGEAAHRGGLPSRIQDDRAALQWVSGRNRAG